MSIKEYIISNFKDSSIEELTNTLNSSLEADDELTLPGMGVFLNLIWSNSTDELKNEIVNALKKSL